jgi:LacI family transcriptional regulator
VKKKKTSQQKIAQDLGVSQTLVSMVLNGRKEGISSASIKRIWDYAVKEGYTPNGMQIDRSGDGIAENIQAIGYILRSPLKLATKSNFFSHVHQGMHEALSQEGIKTLFLGGEDDLSKTDYTKIAQSKGYPLGIVVLGQVQPSVIDNLSLGDVPIVCVSARYGGRCHSVLPNEMQAGEQLIEHLYHLGHRRFGWIGGNKGMMRNQERHEAITQSLSKRDLNCAPKDSITLESSERQDGFNAAQVILANRKDARPTALVCFNGLMARGAIDYLLQNQIKVGQDVSVVALDQTRACEESLPKITCCGSHPEAMGAAAVRLILQSKDSSEGVFSELTIPTQFRDRESSGPAPEDS